MNSPEARQFIRLQLKRLKRNFSTFQLRAIKKNQPERESLFTWYSRQLDERPVITKCVSATLISSTGSILAQYIKYYNDQESKREAGQHTKRIANGEDDNDEPFVIQWDAVGRFAFLNAVFVAPVLHHWYQFINRAVPGSSLSRVLQRTFWDEFVFSPIYIPVFLGGLWTLEGTSPQKIKTMLYNELGQIIVAEWVLWVPTMAITFRYAPVKFQVLVINCVGVVWQTFLSFMANNAHENSHATAVEDDKPSGKDVGFVQKEQQEHRLEIMRAAGGISEVYLEDGYLKPN